MLFVLGGEVVGPLEVDAALLVATGGVAVLLPEGEVVVEDGLVGVKALLSGGGSTREAVLGQSSSLSRMISLICSSSRCLLASSSTPSFSLVTFFGDSAMRRVRFCSRLDSVTIFLFFCIIITNEPAPTHPPR